MEEVHSLLLTAVQKEQTHFRSSKTETVDRRPLSLMMHCDPKLIAEGKLIKITSVMRPKYIQDGIQIVSGNPPLTDPAPKKANLPVVKRKNNSIPLPEKLVRSSRDAFYNPQLHHISKKGVVPPPIYNIDNLDYAWLSVANEERVKNNEEKLAEWMLEDVIEAAEQICHVKMLSEALANGISDESKCDVCRDLSSEDGNEIVFCDKCNIGVHQLCYGIRKIPEDHWFCKRCELGLDLNIKCDLCPFKGGAMKPFKDSIDWAHVSCALWIPAIMFEDPVNMELITGRNAIPLEARVSLCDLCRIPQGVTIKCCINGCKGRFHVTCAYDQGLVMDIHSVDAHVRFFAFCRKHSAPDFQDKFKRMAKRHKMPTFETELNQDLLNAPRPSPSNDKSNFLRWPTSELLGHNELNSPAARFHEHVTAEDVGNLLTEQLQSKRGFSKHSPNEGLSSSFSENTHSIPGDIIKLILAYWRIKRRSEFNSPLVHKPPPYWTVDLNKTKKPETQQIDDETMVLDTVDQKCDYVRNSLKRARIMADMVIQRERRKTDLVQTMRSISDVQLDSVVQDPIGATMDEVISTAHLYEPESDRRLISTLSRRRRGSTRKVITKFVTGNEVVDSIPREELTFCEKAVAMIKEGFARKRGRPRTRPVSEMPTSKWFSYQVDNGDFLVPRMPIRRRGRPRRVLTSVESNAEGKESILSAQDDSVEIVSVNVPMEVVDLTPKINV